MRLTKTKWVSTFYQFSKSQLFSFFGFDIPVIDSSQLKTLTTMTIVNLGYYTVSKF